MLETEDAAVRKTTVRSARSSQAWAKTYDLPSLRNMLQHREVELARLTRSVKELRDAIPLRKKYEREMLRKYAKQGLPVPPWKLR